MLALITPPNDVPDELDTIRKCLEWYPCFLHLRKPEYTSKEITEYISQIPREFHGQISLHQHRAICNTTPCHYHFKSGEPIEKVNANKRRSKSFHSIAEIEKVKDKMDYVFLSPIFKSISKKNHHPQLDWNTEKERLLTLGENGIGVLALGGIDVPQAELVHQMGFSGVAILGAIWSLKKQKDRIIKYKALCKVSAVE